MEKKFIEYLTVLREFGRIYTGKIISSTPALGTDLKLSQIRTLYAFRDRDSLTMRELATSIGVKMPTMTIMVDSLVNDGIVERERDTHDRRKVNVWLTEKGKKIRSDFLKQRQHIARSIFERINPAERKKLLHSLENICAILAKAFRSEGAQILGSAHAATKRTPSRATKQVRTLRRKST